MRSLAFLFLTLGFCISTCVERTDETTDIHDDDSMPSLSEVTDVHDNLPSVQEITDDHDGLQSLPEVGDYDSGNLWDCFGGITCEDGNMMGIEYGPVPEEGCSYVEKWPCQSGQCKGIWCLDDEDYLDGIIGSADIVEGTGWVEAFPLDFSSVYLSLELYSVEADSDLFVQIGWDSRSVAEPVQVSTNLFVLEYAGVDVEVGIDSKLEPVQVSLTVPFYAKNSVDAHPQVGCSGTVHMTFADAPPITAVWKHEGNTVDDLGSEGGCSMVYAIIGL
jgi:hypothetical protein